MKDEYKTLQGNLEYRGVLNPPKRGFYLSVEGSNERKYDNIERLSAHLITEYEECKLYLRSWGVSDDEKETLKGLEELTILFTNRVNDDRDDYEDDIV